MENNTLMSLVQKNVKKGLISFCMFETDLVNNSTLLPMGFLSFCNQRGQGWGEGEFRKVPPKTSKTKN